MNFSNFFIRRPIFAGVLSTLIFVIGFIAMWRLPISEYPEIVPPTIVVQATYPGANPKTISETVAAPLEQVINGVEEIGRASCRERVKMTVEAEEGKKK